jgi:hypothetical protein
MQFYIYITLYRENSFYFTNQIRLDINNQLVNPVTKSLGTPLSNHYLACYAGFRDSFAEAMVRCCVSYVRVEDQLFSRGESEDPYF